MNAKVHTLPGPFKYRAWCPECSDGINTHARTIAEEWAARHEQLRHSKETP